MSEPPWTSAGSWKRYVACVPPSVKRPSPSNWEPSESNSHGASASVAGVNSTRSPITVIEPAAFAVPWSELTVTRTG